MHQVQHVKNLTAKLKENYICFDTSDTGTGKTYSAIATAKYMEMDVFIICPKTIICSWVNVVKKFNINCIGISNYELIIKEKYYKVNTGIKSKMSSKCPYISKTDDQYLYSWKLPENTLIIFDEAHKCSNHQALCGNVLLSLKNVYSVKNPLLLITATICESPHKFKLFSVLLKWCSSYNSVFHWLEDSYNPLAASKIINERLAPKNMCKVKISDLGDSFKKNNISAEYFDTKISDLNQIDKLHEEIKECYDEMNDIDYDRSTKLSGLAKVVKLRMKIELLKVPIFIDLAQQYIDNNLSVVIFVNYTATLELLAKHLETTCLIHGEQTIETRLNNIKNFVNDKKRIIVCNITSGGEGISLNDIHGNHPRVALISPPMSGTRLIQACGRISRINSKTPSFNKIIYANTLTEKKFCNRLKLKIDSNQIITDLDLTTYDDSV